MIKLRRTGTVTISTGEIAASGSYTTDAMDATGLEGFFSLQWAVAGDGTMKAEVLVSNDGVTFLELDSDITSAQVKTSGTGGVNMSAFEVTPCNQFKIKFTETGGANSVTVAARLRAM